ncbi:MULTISPECIES: enoyl-CoA hydratase/isomerase family protein [unclassified Bradyrhizobium]|uniref:enoyl-CoA hydratase/isomerase family protein n=1 Tax=unclassified Bradyrhizobium TaxID=2631580 RepID=UPI0028E6C1A8|nr:MULTISPECIES: enoyl-CoA hydratase/isomerase family protein [unclassified Bradyrhizobium]
MSGLRPIKEATATDRATRQPEYCPNGELDSDIASLTAFVGAARGAIDEKDATAESVRDARERFLERHTDAVYDILTDGRRRPVKLQDLLSIAAERFPMLVPSEAEMARDADRRQADKLGFEIDQALFVRALMRSPLSGNHLIESMLIPTKRATEQLNEFQRIGRIEFETVILERRGAVSHVTIANLDSLNAEDMPLLRDMEAAVDLALLDPETRVGVLRGAEMTHPKYVGRRVFCSGLNLKALRDGRIPVIAFLVARELGLVNKLRCGLLIADDCGSYRSYLEKPWIAAVDSFAIGGGMQLLLAVDSVVAEQNSTFSLPASKEGFVPGAANLRLTRFVGARLARKLILGGKVLHTHEPEVALLCDIVVPPDGMDIAIAEAATQLSSEATLVNRRALMRGEESTDDLRRYLSEFALLQASRMHSSDVIEAVEAFGSPRG